MSAVSKIKPSKQTNKQENIGLDMTRLKGRRPTDLLLELLEDECVLGVRVILGDNGHGSVLEHSDGLGKVRDVLSRHLPFLGDGRGKSASVVLDVLDMSLDLGSKLLEVLNDGSLDGLGKRSVRVGDNTGLVSDGVEDVLKGKGCAIDAGRGNGYIR